MNVTIVKGVDGRARIAFSALESDAPHSLERLLRELRDHGAKWDGVSWTFSVERAAAIGTVLEAAGFRVEFAEFAR